jgi:hypothetical protein
LSQQDFLHGDLYLISAPPRLIPTNASRGKAKKYAGRLLLGRQQLLFTVRFIEGAA